uniref:Uncharacterized protein n=2 Tax=Sus scrofa TaxID=9823 RepID=A0A8D0KEX9_PIG
MKKTNKQTKNKDYLKLFFVNILVTEVYCKYICKVCIFLSNRMLSSSPWNFFPQIRAIGHGMAWGTHLGICSPL